MSTFKIDNKPPGAKSRTYGMYAITTYNPSYEVSKSENVRIRE